MIGIKILVNCALPYANGPLHVGHIAGAYLGADVFVRFNRLIGNEVLYVSGSDEYGTPITVRAEKEGKSPQEIADRYYAEHIETFKKLGINFDIFMRTTYPEHSSVAQEFFLKLLNEGVIEKGTMIAPYCRKIGRFMPDRYIEGECPYCGYKKARGDQCDNCGRTLDPQELINPVCILSGETPEFRETEHFFLRLDLFEERLEEWLKTKTFWKPNVLAYTRNFIQGGLKKRAITRDIDWGVKVPLEGYEHKRIYVWFEALIGYITGAKMFSEVIGKPNYWKEFYFDKDVKNYYFIGKDNIPFHSIIWPAMLLGYGELNLPYDIPANEYLTFKGEQFSKSRGIGYTVDELLRVIPPDYLRYYVASILPETGDSDFSLEELVKTVNSDLIDKYGNFVHRTLSFINKYDLKITKPNSLNDEAFEYAQNAFKEYCDELSQVHIKRSLAIWLNLAIYANSYFNKSEPWNLIKTDRDQCNYKLYVSLKLAQYLTAMIYPFTPTSAKAIWEQLGVNMDIDSSFSILNSINDFSVKPSRIPFEKLDIDKLKL
ncbi:tRNA synthetase Met [Thermoplasma volcanium GSS1]|uniref:Methionine--tRNA ligase n=1 Tax=Thermoplasma volcanium (strain ATCC 51530 / DSM 4299 / JCM 9571 / NBRC 15438 / GSS1) TaxID=273116 RepID=SYM_THEVO|nr:methionine--tRNA ligase [Thermoplasma volcanium]Q979B7.1 RecName: Full=Methionine--tRNA ligase; AltName: Full=Methionyl-tRNA synthetase; Short=MetRS [Thermoplasma volcanium GSS1]BAB60386.1 tRNA synthetase Met [Thermoplasma volcanium GSS1]